MMQIRSHTLLPSFLLLLLSCNLGIAQPSPLSYTFHGFSDPTYIDHPSLGLLVGYHGVIYPTLEAGIAIVGVDSTPVWIVGSVEVYPGERRVVAPRLALSWVALLSFGIGVGYYSDGINGSVRIRPEIGFGGGSVLAFRMVYGLNLRVAGTDPKEVNGSEIGIQFLLPVLNIR